MLIQYTVCEYLKYMIIHTIHVSDNITVNHNQVMFNMICIIRHTYWVSTNTIKCNIHVVIRVPRMCIPVIGYILPLYKTVSIIIVLNYLLKLFFMIFWWTIL